MGELRREGDGRTRGKGDGPVDVHPSGVVTVIASADDARASRESVEAIIVEKKAESKGR